MRRIICVALALSLALSLAACGSSSGAATADASTANGDTAEQANHDDPAPTGYTTSDQIALDNLDFSTDYFNYHILFVTNNSDYDCEVNIDATFLDASDNPVDMCQITIDALSAHCTTATYVMPDYKYESINYSTTVAELDFYGAVNDALTIDYSLTPSSVVGTVTNNGDVPAQFVKVLTVFYNGDQIVGVDETYATDQDSEIKPGASQSFKCEIYGDSFDAVEVFANGRSFAGF